MTREMHLLRSINDMNIIASDNNNTSKRGIQQELMKELRGTDQTLRMLNTTRADHMRRLILKK